jgi:hypothetical protein
MTLQKHTGNEDVREELGITDIRTIIMYRKKWIDHLEVMPDNRIQKLLCQYKPNGKDATAVQQNGVTVLILVTGIGQELNP